jgi:hypothetical protein
VDPLSRADSAQGAGADKSSPCPPVSASYRPPADGPNVTLADQGGPAPADAMFVSSYRNESYYFGSGSWARFGRDDALCEIVVWEELRGAALSRIAGELWCFAGDEMWVRNLSYAHEIAVAGQTGPPQILPPRQNGERGRACSLPGQAVVSVPTTGDWRISVVSVGARPADSRTAPTVDPERTWSIGHVPEHLRPVAAALCAPILLRGDQPASYTEISGSLGVTVRQARRYVDKLCAHYRTQISAGNEWSESGQAGYFQIADLLVSRGRVSRDDLAILLKPTDSGSPG